MGTINLALLLLFLKLITHAVSIEGLQCYDNGNFTTNSTYRKNRDIVLSSLASKVVANNGFYTTSFGSGSDKVYALAQCQLDSFYQGTCFDCVNTSAHAFVSSCPNQYEAISWGQDVLCITRYANRNFIGLLEEYPSKIGFNTGDITSNITTFDDIFSGFMDKTIKKAASSRTRFATGDTNVSMFDRMYALMQCTNDISSEDCDTCLRRLVSDYNLCCHGKRGGYVQKPSCFNRWDLYPFYIDMPDSPSPSSSTVNVTDSTITRTGNKKNTSSIVVIIIGVSLVVLALVASIYALLRVRKRKKHIQHKVDDESTTSNFSQFHFDVINVATNNFSDENKLGEGGFGSVHKGKLQDGQDIAVKRLRKNSGQGDLEFKSEALLLTKLQHKNLVRLLGFCLEGKERLLIYEFVLNSSLDHFIFDPIKRLLLDWRKRFKIIEGIARGILYLHEDSRLKIIHRDLKTSNILLDANMKPKISDFGMAKLFGVDQTNDNTRKIVGTFGYMAPEYATRGLYSMKSDVYSFGVLLLEIISGRKNTSFDQENEASDLINHTWNNWQKATILNIVDPILKDEAISINEIRRCIHIGLLCVQENAASRPTMASVILMLSSLSLSLQLPKRPAFLMHSSTQPNSTINYKLHSSDTINEASFTQQGPR